MQPDRLRELLDAVARGDVEAEHALEKLRDLPYEDLAFAKVDHHRHLRQGWPEAIFCESKTAAEIASISRAIVDAGSNLIATRLDADKVPALREAVPEARYNERGRIAVHIADAPPVGRKIAVVTAGTSDIPVAEEAVETAAALGHEPVRVYDVGVAGIHRVLGEERRFRESGVVIVIAGMEGALLSVVGGLAAGPVIGVPTSVGYGSSFGGLTALLAMLNSCASGTTVVNIDNGFGAACAAHRILGAAAGGEQT